MPFVLMKGGAPAAPGEGNAPWLSKAINVWGILQLLVVVDSGMFR